MPFAGFHLSAQKVAFRALKTNSRSEKYPPFFCPSLSDIGLYRCNYFSDGCQKIGKGMN
jgi:hypothetical protein